MFSATLAVLVATIGQATAQYSACSKSCGGGSQYRESCWGTVCGKSYRACNTHPCVSGWNAWQPCSKTCGGGTRFKVEKCSQNDINKCPKTFGDCGTRACQPLKSCPKGHKFRYGVKSSCCKISKKEKCGVLDPFLNKRVFGGELAELGQWPWAAVMAKKLTDTTHCGGSLIHVKWILTAAHCLSGYKKEDHYVLLGTISIKYPAAASQKIEIAEFKIHNQYSYPRNDIGLVELKTPATKSSVVKPVCLPSGEIVQQDTTCIAAGWGISSPKDLITETPSDNLMQVGLRHLPLDACVDAFRKLSAWEAPYITKSQHLCFGILAGGKDTCRGDSGGPIICQRCQSCNWFLAALTSFGWEECGKVGVPAVYVNVRLYEHWIRQHVPLAYSGYFVC